MASSFLKLIAFVGLGFFNPPRQRKTCVYTLLVCSLSFERAFGSSLTRRI
jgi:hypothetical protein